MTELTQTVCWQQPTNCFRVFDHSVGLVLKGLMRDYPKDQWKCMITKNVHVKESIYHPRLK